MKNNVMLKTMAVAVVLLLSVAGKVNAQATAADKPAVPVPVKKATPAVQATPVVKTVSQTAAATGAATVSKPMAQVQTAPAPNPADKESKEYKTTHLMPASKSNDAASPKKNN